MIGLLGCLSVATLSMGCCDNGEGGMGSCKARIEQLKDGGQKQIVFASFGPRGRRLAEKTALAACGLPKDTDPTRISFTDDLKYKDEDGMEFEMTVYDMNAYLFECPEPGKVSK